ncbi:phage shock protein A [Oikeobacillus pervagus]|uniref:Phage shock protein A n=1 Tax=Oikeobacillus pervagus TaxID=1325931 RepID=A0AAJ1SWS8_9BACI|nr:PspA/IM30 family protein [Oikeobacillus pervagus]MDQ0214009.1 phage shock protein A [Oikeobacillus pervagus]
MSILKRFKDIMASNINALLDKAENPEKMIDQYMRNLNSDLGKVKAETASVMAERQRAKRALNECKADIEKLQIYAIKAVEAGNDEDAKKFLERKASLTAKQMELQEAYSLADANAERMKEMHNKLVSDIRELEARRSMIKGKMRVAKTQERLNKISSSITGTNDSMSAFAQMEEKVNKALDEANAMAELNSNPKDDLEDLMTKYESHHSIDDELAALKMQIKTDE